MAKIFISYSRIDTEFVKPFVANIARIYGHDNIWYDDKIPGGHKWWQVILKQIEWGDIFIYLLSNDSVTSEYCQAEFEEAQRLQKHIITIQVRDRTKLDEALSEIQYINMAPGEDMSDAYTRLYAAVDMYQVPRRKPKALWQPETAKPGSVEDAEPQERDDVVTPILKAISQQDTTPSSNNAEASAIVKAAYITGIFAVIAALIGVVGLVLVSMLSQENGTSGTTFTQTAEAATINAIGTQMAEVATLEAEAATINTILTQMAVAQISDLAASDVLVLRSSFYVDLYETPCLLEFERVELPDLEVYGYTDTVDDGRVWLLVKRTDIEDDRFYWAILGNEDRQVRLMSNEGIRVEHWIVPYIQPSLATYLCD